MVKAKQKQSVKAPPRDSVPPEIPAEDGLIGLLETLARDEDAPAAQRTAAARAVLEARGVLGKHQRPPEDETARKALSEATRPELEAELVRLRQRFAAQMKG